MSGTANCTSIYFDIFHWVTGYIILLYGRRKSAIIVMSAGEPMKYPYTISAKIARFPFSHYLFRAKHGWVFRYWVISAILLMPFWYKIQKLSYHPENVKKWDEIRRKQFSGQPHH